MKCAAGVELVALIESHGLTPYEDASLAGLQQEQDFMPLLKDVLGKVRPGPWHARCFAHKMIMVYEDACEISVGTLGRSAQAFTTSKAVQDRLCVHSNLGIFTQAC